MHSDVSKRDIVEKCVYAWSGKDLVLLPINSQQYKDSCEYTKKQSKKVSARDLVKGYTYSTKKSEKRLVYVGREEFYIIEGYDFKNNRSVGRKHVFYNLETKKYETPTVQTLAEAISEEVHKDYAQIAINFSNSLYNNLIDGCKYRQIKKEDIEKYERGSYNTIYFYREKNCIINAISFIKGHYYNYNEELYSRENFYLNNYGITENGIKEKKVKIEEELIKKGLVIIKKQKNLIIDEIFNENIYLKLEEIYKKLCELNYKCIEGYTSKGKPLISTEKIEVK